MDLKSQIVFGIFTKIPSGIHLVYSDNVSSEVRVIDFNSQTTLEFEETHTRRVPVADDRPIVDQTIDLFLAKITSQNHPRIAFNVKQTSDNTFEMLVGKLPPCNIVPVL